MSTAAPRRAPRRALGRRRLRRLTSGAALVAAASLVVGVALPSSLVAAASRGTSSTASVTTPQVRAVAATAVTASAPGSRPNVLVIETDDMRPDDLRFMPQTQRLIQQRGLTFENSFAPSPLCCPARASFLTGRYSHNHGVHSHQPPYGFAAFDDRTTLATALQAGGYRTGMVGKYLNGYGYQRLRAQHPRPGTSSLTYVPPGWTQWLAGVDAGVDPLARVKKKKGKKARGTTYNYFGLGQNVNGKIKSTPGYSTAIMGKQVRTLIDQLSTGKVVKVKKKGKKKKRKVRRAAPPWFVWWTPIAPHHGAPYEADDPAPVTRDDGFVDTLVTPARPAWVKRAFDQVVTKAPGVRADGTTESDISDKPRWMQRPEVNAAERQAMLVVARQRAESLAALDVEVGRTLERLYASPQGARTVVVFTSDNGYYQGEHRQVQGKGTLLEPSIRTPLMIAGPGVPQGTRFDPFTSVDFAPTIAAMAGVGLPAMDGVDMGPTIRSGDRGWTRAVQTEAMMGLSTRADGMPDSPLTLRGLRLGRWAFTRYANGEVELYDMAEDPLQLENLGKDDDHQDTVRRLGQVLTSYEGCSGAACSAPLPPDLATGPAEVADVTRHQLAETQRYYG